MVHIISHSQSWIICDNPAAVASYLVHYKKGRTIPTVKMSFANFWRRWVGGLVGEGSGRKIIIKKTIVT
jgi:hypothetical protein